MKNKAIIGLVERRPLPTNVTFIRTDEMSSLAKQLEFVAVTIHIEFETLQGTVKRLRVQYELYLQIVSRLTVFAGILSFLPNTKQGHPTVRFGE